MASDTIAQPFPVPQDEQQIVYDKRQQRLIKNRAAALMSRKRKREHLASLEHQAEELKSENDQLRAKLTEQESRVTAVERERDEAQQQLSELQRKLHELQEEMAHREQQASSHQQQQQHDSSSICRMDVEKAMQPQPQQAMGHESRMVKSTSTAGMVFMAIIFSFALLSFPVARITLPLTGGGSRNEGQPVHAQ
ncbi:hypothetical protein SYNPS1DRAFT_24034 [Syncephalis pseudoplumigaleata]|uniref:BZIP domain-containing protein n=1 Tax=Syncephalis pseudoplumigaleata TaxID=1712513 RepID=A0A4P9YVN9_9FUNG|nr:hypothetical protein SYNPS1DRAFT_24034 [Syncephalis pseudoplumigaleata]|eukprot:RKP23885.1 hypothetical protein SYNPS1DRAFT_24034 [Syncephalis pseudoplumigaleata]